MNHVKQIWFLSPMRAAKVQASLRIRAVLPEPSLLAHTSSESRGTFSQKARSLAPLNGWACAVKICHDGVLEDTNSLDAAHMLKLHNSNFRKIITIFFLGICIVWIFTIRVSPDTVALMSHVIRKPIYAICEQHRSRSACTSVQSDQHLCFSLPS